MKFVFLFPFCGVVYKILTSDRFHIPPTLPGSKIYFNKSAPVGYFPCLYKEKFVSGFALSKVESSRLAFEEEFVNVISSGSMSSSVCFNLQLRSNKMKDSCLNLIHLVDADFFNLYSDIFGSDLKLDIVGSNGSVFCHGDCNPNSNILADINQSFCIIDCEDAFLGPVFFDLFFYMFYCRSDEGSSIVSMARSLLGRLDQSESRQVLKDVTCWFVILKLSQIKKISYNKKKLVQHRSPILVLFLNLIESFYHEK